jgi:HK97 family phage prohead protease
MQIKSDAVVEKATRLKEGEVEFVVSTNALDSHGERIDVDGIDFKAYKKNPVVLYGHDGFNLPIARTKKIWKDGNKLMAKAEFYLKDEFAAKVYNYILDGFLSAVSIGGMVKEWADDGMTIAKLEMREFSVVTMPANPEALVSAKSLSTEQVTELQGLANRYARKMLTKNGNGELHQNIDTLETLVATLKEVAHGETSEEVTAQANQTQRVVLKQAQAVDKHVEKIIVQLKGQK